MKKLFLLTASAAILLTGCNTDHTATVIYNDVPPPLTVKTFSESLPPETYSQYMETYTGTSESSRADMYGYPAGMNGDIFADTGITLPPADSGVNTNTGSGTEIYSETVPTAPTVTAMPEPVPETLSETTAPIREEDSETVTCVTDSGEGLPDTVKTSETAETTAFSLIIPKADTGNYGAVSAVTAPSRFDPESIAESDAGESETME